MDSHASTMTLIGYYNTYAHAVELGPTAAADAPATSTVCIATVVSSGKCASAAATAVGTAVSATYEVSC